MRVHVLLSDDDRLDRFVDVIVDLDRRCDRRTSIAEGTIKLSNVIRLKVLRINVVAHRPERGIVVVGQREIDQLTAAPMYS